MNSNVFLDRQQTPVCLTLGYYGSLNNNYVDWFKQHRIKINEHHPSLHLELTGSRSFHGLFDNDQSQWWNLAHDKSDLEYAIIVPDETNIDQQKQLIKTLIDFYLNQCGVDSGNIKHTETRAGLQLLEIKHYSDEISKQKDIDLWKIEVTVRTESIHKMICDNIKTKLSTWSENDRAKYIIKMRDYFVSGDEKSMLEAKAWLKVLPPLPSK